MNASNYRERANTPTEALALDIINAYFANTYGPNHQFPHFDNLSHDQKSLAMHMARAVKEFESDGTYDDLVNDLNRFQSGNISTRALASKIWSRIIT